MKDPHVKILCEALYGALQVVGTGWSVALLAKDTEATETMKRIYNALSVEWYEMLDREKKCKEIKEEANAEVTQ